jgi:hypothetical protein
VALLAVIVNNGSVPPVPVNEIVRVGFAGSLVPMVSVPVSGPATVGVNATVSVQLEFAGKGFGHRLVGVVKLGTENTTLVKVNCPVPVLEIVTVWGALVVFSDTFPKASAAGDTPANAPPPKDTVLDHAEVMFGLGVQ